MDATLHQKEHMEETAAHGCCGGAHKHAAKEDKKDTGCGCNDKQTKPARTKSSCCG